MEGNDLSSLWSHSVCHICLDRRSHFLVSDMGACNPLSQTMGAATVSPTIPLQIFTVLTAHQHYPSALHGSHLRHRFILILSLLPACPILRSRTGLLRGFRYCQFLRTALPLYSSRST